MTEPFVIGGVYKTNYKQSGASNGIIWQVEQLGEQTDGKVRAYGRILYNPRYSDYSWPTWNSCEPESHIRLSDEEGTVYVLASVGGRDD